MGRSCWGWSCWGKCRWGRSRWGRSCWARSRWGSGRSRAGECTWEADTARRRGYHPAFFSFASLRSSAQPCCTAIQLFASLRSSAQPCCTAIQLYTPHSTIIWPFFQSHSASHLTKNGWLCTCVPAGHRGRLRHAVECVREIESPSPTPVLLGAEVVMLSSAHPQWGKWYVVLLQPSKVVWGPVIGHGGIASSGEQSSNVQRIIVSTESTKPASSTPKH